LLLEVVDPRNFTKEFHYLNMEKLFCNISILSTPKEDEREEIGER